MKKVNEMKVDFYIWLNRQKYLSLKERERLIQIEKEKNEDEEREEDL